MKLDNELFEKLEDLSYFNLSKEERIKIKENLENMLKKFQVLDKFDDYNIKPCDFNKDFFEN